MKSIILNDTHAGARNSSEIFINYQGRFYTEVLFPYMRANNITHILHGGDYYEHRKFINFKALQANNEHFLDKLVEYNFTMDVIPGNHDVYYKSTNKLCSLQPLMAKYIDSGHVTIHMEPAHLELGSKKVALIPWITHDNYGPIMNFVNKSDADMVLGHFEFSGFELYPGTIAQHGMDPSLFNGFDLVLSGHYHTKSEKGNVKYLGAQMEFTWGDANDPKFFHVYDHETGELEEVHNPLTLFQKVIYNDKEFDYNNFDFSIFDDKFVKVVVEAKTDPYAFDKFIDKIQSRSIHDLKISESFEDILSLTDDSEIEFEETSDLLDTFVDVLDTELDKNRIKTKLKSLYSEAQQMEYE